MQVTNNVVGLVLRQDNALVDKAHRRPLRIAIGVEFLKHNEGVLGSGGGPRYDYTAIRGPRNLWIVGAGSTGGDLNTIRSPKGLAGWADLCNRYLLIGAFAGIEKGQQRNCLGCRCQGHSLR